MRFRFFAVEALAPTAGEAELNAFCAQHRIASVDKQFVNQGAHSYWLFCLTTVDGDGSERSSGGGRRGRVDYREVLSETDFAVFADLRDLRKTMAEQEGVPMYALFTNEQLAEMVTRESVRQVLAEFRVWLANERRLRLKTTFQINRSERGVTWCGARVLRGTLRLTPRKQRRYRQGCRQWEAAWLAGEIDSLALQRGYDAVHAATLHTDSVTWRKRHPSRYSEQ